MVDFRYHLVSIVAVFLALATGIVLGATALNGGVVHDLNGRIRGLIADKNSLRDQYLTERDRADAGDGFVKTAAPLLETGKLAGRTVVIVSLPGVTDGQHDAAATALKSGGAVISADVSVSDKVFDPAQSALVDDLASRLVPAGISLSASDPLARLGTVLGASVVAKPLHGVLRPDTFLRVVAGLHEAGLVTVSGTNPAPASAAVILVGPPAAKAVTPDPVPMFTLALARSARLQGSAVLVAGPELAAKSGGLLAAIRGDSATSATVSTVDDLGSPQGQVAVVLALAEQFAGGVGQYGSGSGAAAAFPGITAK